MTTNDVDCEARQDHEDREWSRFAGALALSLAQLDSDQVVLVEARRTPGRYVRFTHYGPSGLHGECVDLPPEPEEGGCDEDRAATADELSELGWEPPARAPGDDAEQRAWHLEWSQPVPYEQVAALATATLRSVYGVWEPAFLSYNAFHRSGAPIILPNLGVMRSKPVSTRAPDAPAGYDRDHLIESIREVLAERIGVDEVPLDGDGDIPISTDLVKLFVRVRKPVAVVTVFCPLVWGFGSPRDVESTVNQMNKDFVFARAVWTAVVLVADSLGDPFDADALWNNVLAVINFATTYGPKLHEKYGGSTPFTTAEPAGEQKSFEPQAGYL
jgi:hypothetical protein